MPHPSSSPLHDHGAHAVLVAAVGKMLIGDGLRPEYLQDSSKVLGLLGGQFVKFSFSHPLVFSRVKSMQPLQCLNLVLVLYWDDIHLLFSICKVFLALLKPFLTLPAPLSCLTVQPSR